MRRCRPGASQQEGVEVEHWAAAWVAAGVAAAARRVAVQAEEAWGVGAMAAVVMVAAVRATATVLAALAVARVAAVRAAARAATTEAEARRNTRRIPRRIVWASCTLRPMYCCCSRTIPGREAAVANGVVVRAEEAWGVGAMVVVVMVAVVRAAATAPATLAVARVVAVSAAAMRAAAPPAAAARAAALEVEWAVAQAVCCGVVLGSRQAPQAAHRPLSRV